MNPNSFDTTLAQPKLVVHDYSRTISKPKPKIRIIHIVEPEIIKTEVQNFQELVQRLTGKPAEKKRSTNKGKNTSSQILQPKPYGSKPGSKIESAGLPLLQDTQKMKKDIEEIYDAENQNALLSFLKEVDGFLHDMNEFPLLSLRKLEGDFYSLFPVILKGVAESGIQQKVLFLFGTTGKITCHLADSARKAPKRKFLVPRNPSHSPLLALDSTRYSCISSSFGLFIMLIFFLLRIFI